MFRSINLKSLVVTTSFLILSTSVNATTLWGVTGTSKSEITGWFDILGDGIQYFDHDRSGGSSISSGIWAAGTNAAGDYIVTDQYGDHHATVDSAITGLTAFSENYAYVTTASGTLYQVYGGGSPNPNPNVNSANLTDATNFWNGAFNVLESIKYFDYDLSGAGSNPTGIWAADDHTVTNNQLGFNSYGHTFSETIVGISAVTQNIVYVTLDDGEVWVINGNSTYQDSFITNLSNIGILNDVEHFDYDVVQFGTVTGHPETPAYSTGVWAADANTLINPAIYNGFNGIHIFDDTIIGLSSFREGYAYVLTSPSAVPVPAAVWLMGSALMGLFGFQRKKVGQKAA